MYKVYATVSWSAYNYYSHKTVSDGDIMSLCPVQVEPVLKRSGMPVGQGTEEITQYITEVNRSVGDGEQQEQNVIYTK